MLSVVRHTTFITESANIGEGGTEIAAIWRAVRIASCCPSGVKGNTIADQAGLKT